MTPASESRKAELMALAEREEIRRTGGTSGLAAKLGGAMADLAERHVQDGDPDPCLTCGLKRGTLANMNNGTMMDAMNVLLGLDGDAFGCHHGLVDGEPSKPCARWLAAKRATFDELKAALVGLLDDRAKVDHVAEYVAAWLDRHDPGRSLDNYKLGRLWEKTGPHRALAESEQ
jgi:hypothetical protein